MSLSAPEARLLEDVSAQLAKQGYVVRREPSSTILPSGIGPDLVDAVALGKPRNLAIRVFVQGASDPGRLRGQDVFEGRGDWEYRLYVQRRGESGEIIVPPTIGQIEAGIADVERLLSVGEYRSALVLGWGVLEALVRSVLAGDLTRPQSTASVLQTLTQEGLVSYEDQEILRVAMTLRNKVAHGDLSTEVDVGTVQALVRIAHSALKEARDRNSSLA